MQRSAAPVTLGKVLPFSALPTAPALNDIARNESARLAQAFRGDLAPIRQIILNSATPGDAIALLTASYPDWSPIKTGQVLNEVLAAYAVNGLGGK